MNSRKINLITHAIFVLSCLFLAGKSHAQVPFVVVDSINIGGNVHTKDYIIYNELDFAPGDTIYFDKIQKVFRDNKYRVLGTGLFVNAVFNLKKYNSATSRGNVDIQLNEAWYIYPVFGIELTDRNFNEWITEHNASLKRINFAAGIKHMNVSGNNDAGQIKIQGGTTKKFELDYKRPFFGSHYRGGFDLNIMYKFSKELAYNTINNKLVYVKNDEHNLFKQFRSKISFHWRPGIFNTHTVTLQYNNIRVADSILTHYNPDFISGNPVQQSLDISYSLVHDKRQFQMYPEGGHYINFLIEKTGTGIFGDVDILNACLEVQKYFSFNKKYITAVKSKVKKNVYAKDIPYFNNRSLGYEEDYLNGYELYVIDGEDYFYSKFSQKIKLWSSVIDMQKILSLEQFRVIPMDIYFSLNFDTGYVNNNVNFAKNNFTNRWLYSYGAGLDINVYHNYFQLYVSFNHLKEAGVFFHYRNKL